MVGQSHNTSQCLMLQLLRDRFDMWVLRVNKTLFRNEECTVISLGGREHIPPSLCTPVLFYHVWNIYEKIFTCAIGSIPSISSGTEAGGLRNGRSIDATEMEQEKVEMTCMNPNSHMHSVGYRWVLIAGRRQSNHNLDLQFYWISTGFRKLYVAPPSV